MRKANRLSLLWQLLVVCLLFGALLPGASAQQSPAAREVPLIQLQGAIGPASADYVAHAVMRAGEQGAPLVIVRMDTPGGLDTSMREIIRAIVNSPVPVVTYVGPSGARAASAGAFILTASHVAAMAPGTNVGAATPVQIGAPGGGSPQPEAGPSDKQATPPQTADKATSPSEAKALNDAIAYIRSLAEMRGRNADWAEAAVRDAASLSAQSALQQNVIDIIARDEADLLAQLDGRTVTIGSGEVRLDTKGAALRPVDPNWRTKLLSAITNPNIALILMMLGAYGLLFEFMNPGALYPGTIGAISLLLGLYALSALPVNYAGVALILLGIALVIAEAFSPSFGILGIGGVIAFVLGGTIMFDSDLPEFQIAVPALAAVAVASLGAVLFTARLAIKSRHRKVVSGREELIGANARVMDWNAQAGHVHLHGERWQASGGGPFRKGQTVRVVGMDGLCLIIEPET